MNIFDDLKLDDELATLEEDLIEFNDCHEANENLLNYLCEKSLVFLEPLLKEDNIHKMNTNSIGEIIEYHTKKRVSKYWHGITIYDVLEYKLKLEDEDDIELTEEEIKKYEKFCDEIGIESDISDENKRLKIFEEALIAKDEDIIYIQEKMYETFNLEVNRSDEINQDSNNLKSMNIGRSNSFLNEHEKKMAYTPADLDVIFSGRSYNENKTKRFFNDYGRKIFSLIGVGALILGTAYAGGAFGGKVEVLEEAEEAQLQETDWFNMYWNNVFCRLNETVENENFVNDFLAHYNATNNFHYNATYSLVREGGVNPMWLARYLASNQWSREEFEMLPHLHQFDSRLVNYGNLTIFLSEIDAIQEGIDETNSGPLGEMIDSYIALSELERKNLFMCPRNITDEPPMTIQGRDLSEEIRRDVFRLTERQKGMDPADLHWWAWNKMASEWGLDTSCANETKLLWAISSVFGGYLTNNRHFTDDEVVDYISKQIPAIGLEHLKNDYNFNNSLLWLQRKINPYTIGTGYDWGNSFDEIVFWVDHEYEAETINVYEEARNLWDEYDFDDAVLGRSGGDALDKIRPAITGSFSEPGTPQNFYYFEQYYERYFSKFLDGERVPMDCRPISTTAVLFINAQNHLYLENDKVVNVPSNNSIPFVAEDILVPNHAGTAYLGRNQTAEMNQIPELVLDLGSWQLVKGNKEFLVLSVPPAMWHEVQGEYGLNIHNWPGQTHSNIFRNYTGGFYEPFWTVKPVPGEEVFNRTDYSLITEHFIGLHDGLVKCVFGYGDAPFSRGRYDLLNVDDVEVITEYYPLLGVGVASSIPIGYSIYKKEKRKN